MFDAAFAKPSIFKKLFKKANIAHIRHTYNLSPQTEDTQIYQVATQGDRIIVTQDGDFRALVKPTGAGVFTIPSYVTNEEIDSLLTEYISGKDPKDFCGKISSLINNR